MKMKTFNMVRDINGFNGFGLPFSTHKYQCLLYAAIEETLVVPTTGRSEYPKILAVFSTDPGDSVWVAVNEVAEVPTGSFSMSTSELNPAARILNQGDVLSFITSDTVDQIGVIFYAVT
jgi:hypothetical protein